MTKLYTAALALETWGPDHRFETRIMSSTPLTKGSVQDLIFLGGGDPALTDEDLWKMARALSRTGLKRVQRDLVINNSRFGDVACNVRDRCEAERSSRNAYDAPLSSAGSNYASWSVAVERDAQQSGRVLTRLYPYELPEVAVQGRIESGPGSTLSARRSTVAQGRDVIELSGSLPHGRDGRMLYRSAGDAEMQTGHMLRAFLRHEESPSRAAFVPHGPLRKMRYSW
ncbi:D-alanyl-D-alanine carboxypeptidase [Fodinicurvata halophila]|uniref:D-alanyl-D-alanine carboxypeptidase n=1 Tax=Fodinicurvata halophila TaxID=1419723 RepID=UPI00362CF3B4